MPDDELTGRKSVQKNKLDLNADSDPVEQEYEQDVETEDPPAVDEKEEVPEEANTKPNNNEASGTRKRKPRKE